MANPVTARVWVVGSTRNSSDTAVLSAVNSLSAPVTPLYFLDLNDATAGSVNCYLGEIVPTYRTSGSTALTFDTGSSNAVAFHLAEVIPATVQGGPSTGAIQWTGAGAGSRTPKATGTGAFNFVGAAAGKRPAQGSGTGAVDLVGGASGKRVPKSITIGTIDFVSTAADKRVPKASATGAVNYVGTGTGLSVQRGRQLWQRIDGVLVRRTVHRKVSP
jgi:hypothetical protein